MLFSGPSTAENRTGKYAVTRQPPTPMPTVASDVHVCVEQKLGRVAQQRRREGVMPWEREKWGFRGKGGRERDRGRRGCMEERATVKCQHQQ